LSANKKDVVQLLETIAIYMELKGENPFKTSAFRKAAGALESDDRSLTEIGELTALQGIGKGTAAVIEEYIADGTSTVLKELQAEVPRGLIPLLQLPGLGGKKIAKLYKELGIEDAEGLELACQQGRSGSLLGLVRNLRKRYWLHSSMSERDRIDCHWLICFR